MNPLRTVVVSCALACFAPLCVGADAAVSPAQRALAEQSRQGVPLDWLAPDAPSSHTVKPGDTLWDISKRFLKSPWRWPALWGMNLQDLKNPHLIFPGDVLRLEIDGDRARLTRGGSSGIVRLSPRVRADDQLKAINTIPYAAIAPFLTRPALLDEASFASSGVVFATRDDRLNVGTGGRLYAQDMPPQTVAGGVFSLYRPGRAVVDPDSGATLGVEVVFLGEGKVAAFADGVATLDITNAAQEIGRGDRVISVPREAQFHFVPQAPQTEVAAKVVMMHDRRTGSALVADQGASRRYDTEGGPLSIVVLNRGSDAGLQPGHVLELLRPARAAQERSSFGWRNGVAIKPGPTVPAEQYGNVMIFKSFAKLSYGLVLNAGTSVLAGDDARSAR